MLIIDLCHARLVLGDEMRQGCPVPIAVESAVPVGEQQQDHSAGSQYTMYVGQEPDGFSDVLEDMTADHEVLARIGEWLKPIRVQISDNVGHREIDTLQLIEELLVFLGTPTIDHTNPDARPDREWHMTRADLKARADDMSCEQLAADPCPRVQIGGLGRLDIPDHSQQP